MKVPETVRNLLRSAAPTLLSALALPPPLNGIAATVAARALGGTEADGAGRPVSAEEAIRLIRQRAGDPEILARLRAAETDLQRYEAEAGIRFEELAVEDRKRASELQTGGRISEVAYRHGMRIVWIAMGSILLIILAALWVATAGVPEADAEYMVAAFGLIGTAVGFINGIAGSVVTFYYGSSQGSKDKTDAMADSIRRFGDEIERSSRRDRAAADRAETARARAEAARPPAPPAAPTAPAEAAEAEAPDLSPAEAYPPREAPASLSLVSEMLPDLSRPHRHFATSAEWRMSAAGISVDGAPAARTPGKPRSVERIWERYGADCGDAAVRFGVPVELIVATIATESGGDPEARRAEPRLKTESVGLMQTLVTTAREALGQHGLTGDDLLDPATSIAAGTAYIAQQRKSTRFDPPLVAAAYNAGSLRRDPAPQNRWNLVCYPSGTGAHIDRFVAWFGDAMAVAGPADWSGGGRVPSFAAAFAGAAPDEAPGRSAAAPEEGAAASATILVEQITRSMSLTEIAGNLGLAQEMQARLSAFGYLDPPPDGRFGPISTWALQAFCAHRAIEIGDAVTPDMARALADPANALPRIAPCETHPWIEKVIAAMRERGHWICGVPECRNIVYLEGANPDGTVNADRPDVFNDLRVVFWTDAAGATQVRAWEATTEPGKHFTDTPLNPLGAARIRFGQYKAWRVGTHRAGSDGAHEALVQVSDVSVHRDLDRDHARVGDRVVTGLFGINQHWGYDAPRDNIGRTSAGCLVGRTTAGHREFMAEVKADPRYRANADYRFVTTILPAREVLG